MLDVNHYHEDEINAIENDDIKLFQNNKIKLKLRKDQFKGYFELPDNDFHVRNQDRGTEDEQVFSSSARMKNQIMTQYMIRQRNCDPKIASENTAKLMDYMNDIFEQLYSNRPQCSDYLPLQSEYRCFMLATHLITWELFALFTPEDIAIDPFEFLKLRGGGFFQFVCSPKGLQVQTYRMFYRRHLGQYNCHFKEAMLADSKIGNAFSRLKDVFHKPAFSQMVLGED